MESYKEKYPHLKGRLTKLEKKKKTAEILLDIKDHEGMKLLLEHLTDTINGINTKLLSNDKLETQDREILLADRERCMWLVNVFNAQEQIIIKTREYLDKLK